MNESQSIGATISPGHSPARHTSSGRIARPRPAWPRNGWNLGISLRGLALAALLLYLIVSPILHQSDIIATVLFFALIALLICVTIRAFFAAWGLRKTITVQLANETRADSLPEFVANKVGRVILRTPPFSVPAFFTVSIELLFREYPLQTTLHQLQGARTTEWLLIEDLTFPHRGIWRAQTIRISLRDMFGLSSFGWNIDGEALGGAIQVHPGSPRTSTLPVLSSCQQPGDAVTDYVHRSGDLFDLKPYHPADGMRRVSWKIFARSGQLISRFPEHSMTPEGQVLIFAAFGQRDDEACRSLLGYAKQLLSLDLRIFVGCEGSAQIASRYEEVEDILINSVWEIHSNAQTLLVDFQRYLDGVKQQLRESSIDKVVIFVSAKRLHEPNVATNVQKLLDSLTLLRITPVLFIERDTHSPEPGLIALPKRFTWVKGLLIDSPTDASSDTTTATTPEAYFNFLRGCANQQWEVISTGL